MVDLRARLVDNLMTPFHLMVLYAPFVPPKYVLKRKDVTREIVNAQDQYGNSPLLKAAARGSSGTIAKIFASKNAKGSERFP